jgi:hypothetical protein
MVVYGLTGGLDQKNVTATDGFFQRDGSFAVGEGLDSALANGNPQFGADGLCKIGIGVTGENLDVVVGDHRKYLTHISFLYPAFAVA